MLHLVQLTPRNDPSGTSDISKHRSVSGDLKWESRIVIALRVLPG